MMSAAEYKNDPQWVHRISSLFDLMDFDKNGYLEPADWQSCGSTMSTRPASQTRQA